MEPLWSNVAELNNLEKSIDALYSKAGAASGLSDSTFDILYSLTVYGDDCSQRELCDRCWIGKQTIHSAIRRLADRGLLSVEPGRGRATRVLLTSKGQAVIEEKIRPVVDAESRALASLAPEERNALYTVLDRYRNALESELAAVGGTLCR